MSGTSYSGSSDLSENPPPFAENTAATLGAGLAEALAKSSSRGQTSPPISPPSKTGGGTAFVKSSTRKAVTSSPLQGGSQEPSARGGGGDAEKCKCAKYAAKRVAEAGPPPLSKESLSAFRRLNPADGKNMPKNQDAERAAAAEMA